MNTILTAAPRARRATWLVPLASLFGAGALLGLSTNLAKLAGNAAFNPLTLLTWAIVGATVVLTVINASVGALPRPSRRLVEYAVVSAFVGVVVPNLVLFAAVGEVGAGFVALSISFPPLITYVGALVLGLECFDRSRALGVVLAMAGAALLAVLKLNAPDAATGWILAVLAVPVVLAVGNIYRTVRWPGDARPEELAPGMLIAASVMLLVAGLAGWFPLRLPAARTGPLLLVVSQTAAFALQYVLFFIVQKRGGPVYLSLLGSVAAIVGIPLAVALLGETPPAGLGPGAILIGAGIYLVVRRVGRPDGRPGGQER